MIAAYLKRISFLFAEIFTFLYYANEESDDLTGGSTKTVQHSIKNISRNIGRSSVLQTWHQKCTSQKKHNDTYYVVAMTCFSQKETGDESIAMATTTSIL